ncbi:MAG: tRNA guanosine(34) transglycosylase Tgt [Patescibacteria group bacterium]
MFSFTIGKKSKKSFARLGTITTPHGVIQTPAFIPVATLGVVKGGLDMEETERSGIQCQITNTFHFLDLNAVDLVKKAGGLHKFFQFSKPIFTDSGGFQVFSLGKGTEYGFGKIVSFFPEKQDLQKRKEGFVKITEDGVTFRSPRDGRTIILRPEDSAATQKSLGADFIYLLDICGTVLDDKAETKRDLERTNRWFKRFLDTKISPTQATFGIIQGGTFRDLRKESAKAVSNLPVFGIAIGGALGKSKADVKRVLSWVNEYIDWEKPHHMLGIGDLESIPEMIKGGIDLFDCALPTRIARHGTALTTRGYLQLKKAEFRNDMKPIIPSCICFTCLNYSRAHLHFLLKGYELLPLKLLTIHNLGLMEQYVANIREKIAAGKI